MLGDLKIELVMVERAELAVEEQDDLVVAEAMRQGPVQRSVEEMRHT